MKRLAVLALVAGMGSAHAEAVRAQDSGEAKWKKECASCHVAYPPRLMSTENWQSLMGNLESHFGANAALDAKERQAILGYLQQRSGSGGLYSSPTSRLSDTPWFKREHRVIAEKEWTHAKVKSRSNCESCHGATVLGD